ncbi:MAG: Stp1/IreP family PP2C-type Ser/Thr phosphatase [Chitinophagaceae bacterium]|nr:Stp1/IreP family PP2C-type Ser/Thr phosphatase [Chitinophagaceae bacterium]MBL0199052.1 Stp1/IreP family PP2C-type Ser/Thr phosphatase [Chitinophagaceae bacterium]
MGWISNLFGNKNKPVEEEHSSNSLVPGNIKAVVVSDLGNIRTNNEDMGLFFKVADEGLLREKGYMLIVADGMGGHQAGEVASRMATDIISHEYFKQNGAVEKNLAKVLALANKTIFEKASSSDTHKGMGTTCTVLVVIDKAVYYAHVGDSRAYIQKDNSITQITSDHTYVQELVNSGDITAEEAATHPKRNILTNAMGTKPDMRIDTGKCEYLLEENDRLLLCSDGLYDYLNSNEIKEILIANDIKKAADIMIQQAKARGGHDNITVVIAERKNDTAENELKSTREVQLPKITRDAELPT